MTRIWESFERNAESSSSSFVSDWIAPKMLIKLSRVTYRQQGKQFLLYVTRKGFKLGNWNVSASFDIVCQTRVDSEKQSGNDVVGLSCSEDWSYWRLSNVESQDWRLLPNGLRLVEESISLRRKILWYFLMFWQEWEKYQWMLETHRLYACNVFSLISISQVLVIHVCR